MLGGCGGRDVGPLIGHAFGRDPRRIFFGFPSAAEVSAPPPGDCWVMTEIVIRYHVGIRHYSATDPFGMYACGKDASNMGNAVLKDAETGG